MAGKGAPLGNRYAAKENRQWGDMMRRKVAQNPNQLEKAALAVLNAAAEGEPWAVTELRNTLDGKAVQQVEHSGDMNFSRTLRDLTDDELLRIATQAQAGKQDRRMGDNAVIRFMRSSIPAR